MLLQVGAVSVCGSDVHQAYGTHSWPVNIPVALGHEFGGTVAAAGRDVKDFREGDRVVSETAAVICGACLMCRTGRYNLCPTRKGFGYGVNGAMAEYVKVPARCLHHVPDSLPFELACLTEPHSVAYNAMCENATIRPGDTVVVLGPGPIGLLCARMAALSGAHPLIVAGLGGDAARLATARALGATHAVNIQAREPGRRGSQRRAARRRRRLRRVRREPAARCRAETRAARWASGESGWSPDQIPVDLNPLVQKNLPSRDRSATTIRSGSG